MRQRISRTRWVGAQSAREMIDSQCLPVARKGWNTLATIAANATSARQLVDVALREGFPPVVLAGIVATGAEMLEAAAIDERYFPKDLDDELQEALDEIPEIRSNPRAYLGRNLQGTKAALEAAIGWYMSGRVV